MLKRIFLALVVLSPIFLQAQLVAKSLKAANGQTVGFYEFTPSDYTKTGAKHPLLIFLHGISERGDGSPTQLAYITKVGIPKYIKNGATMRFNVDGKWHSFVVLMPQLSPNYGAWQTFHTDEMINYAIKNLNVDPDRIYLTGLSLGGGGVWSYASSSLANASKLAAIVPVCGTCAMSNAGNIVNGNVAVWAFHGDADTKVSASCSKNAINSIQALKPKKDALLTLYNTTSHVIWDRAYDFEYKYQNPNVWEWMLRQSRSSTSTNKPPVANAGPDQTVLLPGTLTLNGSGSDPDGTISSYTWSYVSGPNSYKIVSPNSKSTEVTNLVVGTYVFRLTVKDNSGASTVDDVTVTVKTANNKPPVANAGPDQTITLPTNSIKISGSASDPDGTVASYSWSYVSGPSSYKIESPNNRITEFTNLVAGTYVFRLTVKDNEGASHYDDVTITVKSSSSSSKSNKPPVANAGPDQTITLPTNSVKISGSATDPDGTISTYRWSYVSGPSSYKITAPNNRITEFTGLVAGTYVFRLTVTDNGGATHYDDVTITVKSSSSSSNKPPVANAGPDQTITLPTNSVKISGSATDPDGTISTYRWSYVSGPSSYKITAPNNRITEFTGLVAGTYVFRLTVTDNGGATHYDDVTITVKSSSSSTNKPPVANVGPDQTITLPTNSVKISASATDPDGTISTYRWSYVSGPNSYKITAPNNRITEFTNLVAGTYVFRLTVTDNGGATNYADVTITVKGNAQPSDPVNNQAPVADAGKNQKIEGTSTTLDGSNSKDPDGKIVTVKWTQLQGPVTVKIASPASLKTSVTGMTKPGVYVFRLRVYDEHGARGQDDMSVNVVETSVGASLPDPDPAVPQAYAGKNQKVTGSSTTLDGTGSTGKVAKYEWVLLKGPNQAKITSPNSATTTVTGLIPGDYIFRLFTYNSAGEYTRDDVGITVVAATSSAALSAPANEVLSNSSEANPATLTASTKLYPNPATSVVNVQFTSEEKGSGYITIYDVAGKAVKKIAINKQINQFQQTVDISGLINGVYYMDVTVNNKKGNLTQFVKQ